MPTPAVHLHGRRASGLLFQIGGRFRILAKRFHWQRWFQSPWLLRPGPDLGWGNRPSTAGSGLARPAAAPAARCHAKHPLGARQSGGSGQRPRQGAGAVGEGRVVAAARLARPSGRCGDGRGVGRLARRQRGPAGLPCGAVGHVHRCRRAAPRSRRPRSRHAALAACQRRRVPAAHRQRTQVPDPGADRPSRFAERARSWSRSTASGTWSSCSGKGNRRSSPVSTRKRAGPTSGPRAGSRRRSRTSCRWSRRLSWPRSSTPAARSCCATGQPSDARAAPIRAEFSAAAEAALRAAGARPSACPGRGRVRGQHRLEPRRLGGLGLRPARCLRRRGQGVMAAVLGAVGQGHQPEPRPRRSGRTRPRPSATVISGPVPARSSRSPSRKASSRRRRRGCRPTSMAASRIPAAQAPPCDLPLSNGSSRAGLQRQGRGPARCHRRRGWPGQDHGDAAGPGRHGPGQDGSLLRAYPRARRGGGRQGQDHGSRCRPDPRPRGRTGRIPSVGQHCA